jgi:hypothetical protein
MSKFVVKKKVSLKFLGDDWKDAYLILSPLKVNEFKVIQKLSASENSSDLENMKVVVGMAKILREHFISGKGWDGQALISIEAKDLEELPIEVLSIGFEALSGTPDPKL